MDKEKKFSKKLRRKYRLTIHNENKLKNVLGFYISPFWVILSLFFSFLLVAGVIYLVIVFTPVRSLLPGYVSETTKSEFIRNNLRIDSLINEVNKRPLSGKHNRHTERRHLDRLYKELSATDIRRLLLH